MKGSVKMDVRNVLTVAQLSEINPAFSQATIRWWIFNADQNGFNQCLIRIGGRVYIDRPAFESWLENHRIETLAEPIEGE